MNIEELLENEEVKKMIQSQVDEQVSGLKNKNEELLGKLSEKKNETKSLQEQIDEIKQARELAEQEAAEKSGDIEKIKENMMKNHQKEVEALKNQLNDKDQSLSKLLIDNGLTKTLTEAKIAPQYLEAVSSLIKSKHKIEILKDGDNLQPVIDGTPLNEFVSEWSQSDQGKNFVSAPVNGGGGAQGANGAGKASAVKGNLGGTKQERVEAFKQKYPEL